MSVVAPACSSAFLGSVNSTCSNALATRMAILWLSRLPITFLSFQVLLQFPCRAGRTIMGLGSGLEMTVAQPSSAKPFLPRILSIPPLNLAARKCQGCALYERATQTVFGEGPEDARVIMVGEQPGDNEDRQGKPFVGNAGKLLDRALEEAGVVR